jgi:serine/threonine protein kinase
VRYVDSFAQKTDLGLFYFLIMENCEGGELRGFIKSSGGKKELLDVYLKYFTDIVEGLAEIHGRKQMHRDLKPENVFIFVVGKSAIDHILKLGDFGIARDAEKTLMSAVTAGKGTPLYMSPEQHDYEPYGTSSDIWAAGIILFEMLAGYHPFKSIKDLKKNPPEKLPEYVPADIKELLANMLDKEPTNRMTIDEIKRWLYLRHGPSKVDVSDGAVKEEAAALKDENAQLKDNLKKTKSALEIAQKEASELRQEKQKLQSELSEKELRLIQFQEKLESAIMKKDQQISAL